MAQQIKKKFLSPEIIDYFDDQIDLVEQGLEQEIIDRENGDEALQEQIDTEKGRIDAILEASDADKDSFKEIVDLINSIDTDNDEAFAGYVLSNNERVSSLEERVDVLEDEKEVLEFSDAASFPLEGEASKIYVAKDSNKIFRYEEGEGGEVDLPVIPAAPTLTPTISITSADDLQATINNANDGDVIFLANGTYSYAGLSVAKQIALVGESQAGVLVQDSRGNSQSFLNISVNNVTLKDLTVRHVTTDSSIGIAITVSGPGFPQARLNNFRMYNVKSQYSKGGLSVRSDNFVVEGCAFEVVAGSSTRRGILHYGNGGDSFIKNNLFINATTGALRAICPTATSGTNPSDNQSGSLTIEGSTFSGNLSQFVNMDNHQGTAGDFELIVKDNVTPETNAFVVSFGGVANFGDLFSRIVLIGNTLTNNHALGLGKGVLAIDGINGPLAFRSSPLDVVSSENTLGQLDFRAGYAESSGSTGSIVGYATAQITQPTVVLVEGGGPSGSYVELSPLDADAVEGIVEELIENIGLENYATTDYVDTQDAATLASANDYTDQQIGLIPEVDLSNYYDKSEIDSIESGLDTRIDALEAKAFSKGSLVVGAELSYVDLDREYSLLLSVSIGRLSIHEGEDYTVSVVDGKTRLTWIGSLVNPDGVEAIETGDKIFWCGSY